MLALVPVLVYLTAHEDEIAPAEGELARRLPDEVVQRSGDQPRLRCLLLRAAPVAQVVHEVVVAVQRYRRLLRRAAGRKIARIEAFE